MIAQHRRNDDSTGGISSGAGAGAGAGEGAGAGAGAAAWQPMQLSFRFSSSSSFLRFISSWTTWLPECGLAKRSSHRQSNEDRKATVLTPLLFLLPLHLSLLNFLRHFPLLNSMACSFHAEAAKQMSCQAKPLRASGSMAGPLPAGGP